MGTRPLSYRDAARLLGVPDNPLVKIVGAVTGAGAAAVTLATLGANDFFALRAEVINWGNAAVDGLRERITGVSRFDRTERLAAAHAVVVVTSFYEALDVVLTDGSPLARAVAQISAAEQVALATSTAVAQRYADVLRTLIDEPPPMPAPHRPFEATLDELAAYFATMAGALGGFFAGLEPFENRAVQITLGDGLDRLAVQRYTEAYRSLIARAPEFGAWAGMVEAQATRALLKTGFGDLSTQLHDLHAAVDAVLSGLGKRYRAAVTGPILESADAPAHVALPSLDEAYVNPHGRVAVAGPTDLPATESWWETARGLADVQGYLLAYLSSPEAVRSPLTVLGHPGSGKSAMTKVFAARLPSDFLVIRVELRNVRADATIQSQVEQALLQTLGEHVSWPDLVRRAGPALPVVVLDGFDELLQVSGLNRADYLDQIRQFQQRERELDRPVAVLVTSRTVVADRTRFPPGSVVLRLEPFDDGQVRAWLDVWNGHNAAGLARRGLLPLSADAALAQGELARQPLLLLLLALYDAGANALQPAGSDIRQVDLYERLFADFVEREIDKQARDWSPEERAAEIDAEWRRLGAVAVAILNRGGDVILDDELNADIPLLLSAADLGLVRSESAHRALSASQIMVGRFFFIHESRTARGTFGAERSFEFLHATFGDFLAARHIVTTFADLAEERVYQRRRRGAYDAGDLHAATSFVTVTRRAPLWEFCRGLLSKLDAEQRRIARELALELLPEAGYAHPTWSRGDYEPRRLPFARRHSAFSANLACFVVILSPEPVDAVELVGEPVVGNWRKQALLWQSQLDDEDRKRLALSLRVAWRLDADPTRLEVRLEDGSDVWVYRSLPWPPDVRPAPRDPDAYRIAPDLAIVPDSRLGRSLRLSAFVQTAHEVRESLYDLMPYWRAAGHADLYDADETEPFSETSLFLDLMLSPVDEDERSMATRSDQFQLALAMTDLPRQRDLLISRLSDYGTAILPGDLPDIFNRLRASDLERNTDAVRRILSHLSEDIAEQCLRAVNWNRREEYRDHWLGQRF
ncbi:NACHT domain-containing protein [Actinoplanes sp. NPDC049265]|uniref:NACHT domain-containing protein n=1 Tax=Actinoplanes sp. NPDC049265 TaxID=3363902 RepID=UPI003721CFC1